MRKTAESDSRERMLFESHCAHGKAAEVYNQHIILNPTHWAAARIGEKNERAAVWRLFEKQWATACKTNFSGKRSWLLILEGWDVGGMVVVVVEREATWQLEGGRNLSNGRENPQGGQRSFCNILRRYFWD